MQRGSLKVVKLRGVRVWRAQWREDRRGRTRILGRYADLLRADAQLKLNAIVAAVNGRAAPPRSINTFREYVEHEYLVQRSRVWKASTASTTERLIELYLLKDLGARPLSALTRRELQAHLDQLAGANRSESIVKQARFQLQAIFALAKGDGLVPHDPTEGLVNPKDAKPSDARVITLDQMQAAVSVLDIRERLIFQLAAYQGMRPGEIVGLQLNDINGDVLSIRRRIYEGKVDTPKSRRGDRPVPLTRQTKLVMDAYLGLRHGAATGDAWLFPSETGITPVSYSNVWQDHIRPELAKIGLGFVNYQILRRSWVTEFATVEKDPHVRAHLAGHSVDVSENQYRQGKPEVLRESMNKWSDRLQ